MNSRCFLRFRGGPALLVLQPIIFALSLFGSALHPLSKSEVEVNRHSNAGKHQEEFYLLNDRHDVIEVLTKEVSHSEHQWGCDKSSKGVGDKKPDEGNPHSSAY